MPRAYRANRNLINYRIRKQVFERDAYRCQECGDWHDLEVDHVTPLSRGGSNDLDNLQTLCRICNRSKGNRFDEHLPIVPFAPDVHQNGRKSSTYMLDLALDPQIRALVNRGVFRSKSDLVETAIRELLARHEDDTEEQAA